MTQTWNNKRSFFALSLSLSPSHSHTHTRMHTHYSSLFLSLSYTPTATRTHAQSLISKSHYVVMMMFGGRKIVRFYFGDNFT